MYTHKKTVLVNTNGDYFTHMMFLSKLAGMKMLAEIKTSSS